MNLHWWCACLLVGLNLVLCIVICCYSTRDAWIVRFVTNLLVAYLQVIFWRLARQQQSRFRWIFTDDVFAFVVGVNLVLYVLYVVTQHLMYGIFRFVVENTHMNVVNIDSYVNNGNHAACRWCDRPLMLLESICACICWDIDSTCDVRILGILCG